jgi:hypothetical protein
LPFDYYKAPAYWVVCLISTMLSWGFDWNLSRRLDACTVRPGSVRELDPVHGAYSFVSTEANETVVV